MRVKTLMFGTGIACCLTVSLAYSAASSPTTDATLETTNATKLAQIVVGQSTKTQIQSLLGKPWRVVQFNDCGDPMPGQADETWEYRGRDASGGYRFHIEFDDKGVAQLAAKIPDQDPTGKGTQAAIGPGEPDSMAGMPM